MTDFFTEKTPFAADKVGFAIYHFGQAGVDAFGNMGDNTFAYHGYDREQCDYQESLGYMNYYSYRLHPEQYMHLRRTRAMGATNWMHYFPFVKVELLNGTTTFMPKPGWKEEITKIVEDAKKAGLWDSIAGFHFDEPLLHTDGETFEEFSKFLSQFGKRQFGVFSIYEIKAGSHPRSSDPEFGMTAHLINPSNTQYLTDIGYDWYHDADYDAYKAYNELMLNDIQRDNIYVWGFPTTWTARNPNFNEDLCIRNLEMHRKLLDDCRYPGGLYCYTWRSWHEGLKNGLDHYFDTNNPDRWNRLEAKMIEIGKELGQIKLKPLK